MTVQLTYLLAREQVADLQRAADEKRLVRAAKSLHPSGQSGWSLARLSASWSRWLQRPSPRPSDSPSTVPNASPDAPDAADTEGGRVDIRRQQVRVAQNRGGVVQLGARRKRVHLPITARAVARLEDYYQAGGR